MKRMRSFASHLILWWHGSEFLEKFGVVVALLWPIMAWPVGKFIPIAITGLWQSPLVAITTAVTMTIVWLFGPISVLAIWWFSRQAEEDSQQ